MSPDGLKDGILREGRIAGGAGAGFVQSPDEVVPSPGSRDGAPQPKRLEEVEETTCVYCGTKFPRGEAHSPAACQAAQEARRAADPNWKPGAEAAAALSAAEGTEGGDAPQVAPEARDDLAAAQDAIERLVGEKRQLYDKISELEAKLALAGLD